jgi:hypothetical protein
MQIGSWYSSMRMATVAPDDADQNIFLKCSRLAARRRILKTLHLQAPEDCVEVISMNPDQDLKSHEQVKDIYVKSAQKGPDFAQGVLEGLMQGIPLGSSDHVLFVVTSQDSAVINAIHEQQHLAISL